MMPFFIRVIQYHTDNGPNVHNSDITTQSKIPLFVFKHLASYTLINYGKTLLSLVSLWESICAHVL